MAIRYHINSNNEAKECKADKRKCRYDDGGGENHYNTFQEAQTESERRNKEEYGGNFVKRTRKYTKRKNANVETVTKPVEVEKENKTKSSLFEYSSQTPSVQEKIIYLKSFVNKTSNMNDFAKGLGFSNFNETLTKKVIDGEYPSALFEADNKMRERKMHGLSVTDKDYLLAIEEAAHKEATHVSSLYNRRTTTPSYKEPLIGKEPKLLSDDEILDPNYKFDEDDEDFNLDEEW